MSDSPGRRGAGRQSVLMKVALSGATGMSSFSAVLSALLMSGPC